MASIVSVEQLKGLASGSTPNTISIPAGQTLHAPGHIIQVIEGPEFHTTIGVTATTYFDLGLSVTITPKSSTSKIFVMTNVHCYLNGTGFIALRVVRGSTEVVEAA